MERDNKMTIQSFLVVYGLLLARNLSNPQKDSYDGTISWEMHQESFDFPLYIPICKMRIPVLTECVPQAQVGIIVSALMEMKTRQKKLKVN